MTSYTRFDTHDETWKALCFDEFYVYSNKITYYNQEEYGDGQIQGCWFYIDINNLVIYTGSFGNDNAPGASMYTTAHKCEDDIEFDEFVDELESKPEYLDEEFSNDYE